PPPAACCTCGNRCTRNPRARSAPRSPRGATGAGWFRPRSPTTSPATASTGVAAASPGPSQPHGYDRDRLQPRQTPLTGHAQVLPTQLPTPPPPIERLLQTAHAAVEELKARDVTEIDVRGKSRVTDFMVIASGTSTRHVKAIADEVVRFAKKLDVQPLGVEGEGEAEWVLVDLGDVVVHVMLPRVREFYALERLWTVGDQPPPEIEPQDGQAQDGQAQDGRGDDARA